MEKAIAIFCMFIFLITSCSITNDKIVNMEELERFEQRHPELFMRINAVGGEYVVHYKNPFMYQQISINESNKVESNRFIRLQDVVKLKENISYTDVVRDFGIPIIIADTIDDKQIMYFQRGFSLKKGFYLSPYVIIICFKNNLLESCREEYFFRP